MKINLTAFAVLIAFFASAAIASAATPEEEAKALDIYRTVIAFKSTEHHGETPQLAAYLKSELVGAGYSPNDVEVVPVGETAVLIARLPGDGSSGKKPVLFLAHMDVVEANPADWENPPFELREEDGWFLGRGAADNKYGVVNLTQAFMRLKQEGFVPDRDLILVFSGDEETSMTSTRYLANDRPDLAEAEYALNSDAAGLAVLPSGEPLPYYMQSAEKTYASFRVTARNPGGHSSRPRADNAIYDLAHALVNIQNFEFPVESNSITRAAARADGAIVGGKIGKALIAFADNPKDKKAIKEIKGNLDYSNILATTCVATLLDGGHADNALPQSASATVNCRIFPGTEIEEVRQTLIGVIGNDALEVALVRDDYVASPISEPNDEVIAVLKETLSARFPAMEIVPSMSSGGTDGMHFRRAGVPTYGAGGGVSVLGESENAHGLNERLRVKSFYDGLDHWVVLIKALAGPDDAE